MNRMSLHYFCLGSYWRNLTSPLIHWHRGTAVQIDTMKDHSDMQVAIGELGTDIVVVTMAARIAQSIFTLARNLLHRRPLGWKIIPGDLKSKALQTVLWMCWNIVDILLAVEITNVLVYKNLSKHSTRSQTAQSMNTISLKCHMVPVKEPPSPNMENLQGNTYMEEVCDLQFFSDMDILVSKETLLPSCTNPLILSMICIPSEDGESASPSEESNLSEFESDGDLFPCEESSLSDSECGEEETEKESSLEDTSVDSGMQMSWTTKSKEDMDDSEEQSDWSDEEDDSWDAEHDVDYSKDDDLWNSFCQSDDPYNPFSFTMPTRSPKQQVKKEKLIARSEKHPRNVDRCLSIGEHGECQTLNCTMRLLPKMPVLSSFNCSPKCANRKEESETIEGLQKTGNPEVKKVRFACNVTVHHMVTWSYAYRMARKGPWEEYARDRSRFQKRIAETGAAIGFCLEPCHREKIWAAIHCKEN